MPRAEANATLPVAGVAPACCPNCGARRVGEYCFGCGQQFRGERLSIPLLASEFVERFLDMESGLLLTFREMCLDPGGLVRRYVDGQRRRYASPFTYLCIGIALALLNYALFEPQFAEWMQSSMTRSGAGEQLGWLTPAQTRRFSETMLSLNRQATLTSFAMVVPFAFLLRLFFRSTGVNLAETSVFALFCMAHVSYLWALLGTPMILAGADVGVASQASMLLYVLVPAQAARAFFGRRASSVVKTVLAMALTYLIFPAALWAGVLGYVLLTT